MSIIDYSLIRKALIVKTDAGQFNSLYTWILTNCVAPVFSDIHMKDIPSYFKTHHYDMENDGPLNHFLFFYSENDALLLKLTWGGKPFTDNDWRLIRDITQTSPFTFLAHRNFDGSLLVDSRVAHVR